MYMKLLGIIICICQILEKKLEYNETAHQVFTDFMKAYDSVRKKLLYNILIVRSTHNTSLADYKIRLNETQSKVRTGKHLSDTFPIQNGLTRRCFVTIAFKLCFTICH
jgi:hypothetical protein